MEFLVFDPNSVKNQAAALRGIGERALDGYMFTNTSRELRGIAVVENGETLSYEEIRVLEDVLGDGSEYFLPIDRETALNASRGLGKLVIPKPAVMLAGRRLE